MRRLIRNGQAVDTESPFVFVTQESNHDYRLAEEFGELCFLSVAKDDDFNNVKYSEHNRRMVAHLKHGLRDFDADKDYIVLTGSPYVNAAVALILGARRVKRVQFLRWDNRDNIYIPLTIELERETADYGK